MAGQGSNGDRLARVEGEVEVVHDGEVIAVRGPGEYIGEIALLDNRSRTTTLQAKPDVVAEVLNRAEFASLLERAPDLSGETLASLARRLADLESESSP